MPNMFLGFPVSRAKIAEMIEGYAPPLAHHERHELGGDDEIDCTGLTGAGGAAEGFAFDNIAIQTPVESIDSYEHSEVGSGAVSANVLGALLETGGTVQSNVYFKKRLVDIANKLTWDKTREFLAHVRVAAATNSTGEIHLGMGQANGTNYIEFFIDDGVLKARWNGGGSVQSNTIDDWGSGAYDEELRLRIVHTPGDSVKFYVNDALEVDDDTDMLTGATQADRIMSVYMWNKDQALNRQMWLSYWAFYQEM